MGQFDRLLKEPGLNHGFSTRKGGVSTPPFDFLNLGTQTGDSFENTTQNRQKFFQALGFSSLTPVVPRQVHENHVAVVADPGEQPAADAVITDRGQIPLTIQVADCVPVFLFDPAVPCIGLVHAGWRGTEALISAKTVHRMKGAFDSDPQNLRACIGPSIGPCCYETGDDVRNRFHSKYIHGKNLDLPECNRDQLISAGLRPENVQKSGICTHCHPDLFFSHRASGGETGRMMAVMMLRRK